MDSLERIRQANQDKAKQAQEDQRIKELVSSNAHIQKTIFEAFQTMADAVKGDTSKSEAISQIFKLLEALDDKRRVSETEVAALKEGLKTLEKELKDIPTGDLKNIPKFLQSKDKIQVTNLKELKDSFDDIIEAIKAQKLEVKPTDVTVKAPSPVVVPAPVVKVDAPDLRPLETSIDKITKAVKDKKYPETIKNKQLGSLLDFDFDEYKLQYDDFMEDEDPRLEATVYYLKGKKVATLKYSYNSDGQLTGGKKVMA